MSWNPVDCSEECDYNYLKKRITDVLRKHLPHDDDGNPNPEFDDCFTAEEAISEIYEIIGGFTASSSTPEVKQNVKLEVSDIDWDPEAGDGHELPKTVEIVISEADWLDKDNLDGVVADVVSEKHGVSVSGCCYRMLGYVKEEVDG